MAVLDRACPLSTQLPAALRRALLAALALVAAVILVTAAGTILGVGGVQAAGLLRDWGSGIVYVVVAAIVALRAWRIADQRRAWVLFSSALGLYGLGSLLWFGWVEHQSRPSIPSVSDGLWLSFYPLSYLGLLALARRGGEVRLPAGAWLDGIVAGAGFGAVGAAFVFEPALASARGAPLAVATDLAYPIGDLLLVALALGLLAVRGWQLARVWRLLAGGLLTLAAADCLYAAQVAHGRSIPADLTQLAYLTGISLLGLAAWQPAGTEDAHQTGPRAMLAMPVVCTLAVFALLQYDHVRRLDVLAFTLADVTLAAAAMRSILAVRDIRELARARREADTDHLTALPNRRALMRLSRQVIARAGREGDGAAMLMFDLDNFKEINDTLGHDAGDELLAQIGPRLRERLRDDDVLARLGGDEFALVLPGCPTRPAAGAVAEAILAGLREPFAIGGLSLRMNASIGIALFPGDGADEHDLLTRADIAMYEAKRAHRGYEFYASERNTHSTERLSLAGELAGALERDELEVHFQPKGTVSTGSVVGVEALVRWRRDDGSLMSPAHFLAAAEHAGLSCALTGAVLDIALGRLACLKRQGHALHVAVNTTVSDLLDAGFCDRVAAALARVDLEPEDLVLEVTESSVLCDPERIGVVLRSLYDLGVGIALDDFGTGYSSLSHLASLPVSELKIDRSFVADIAVGGRGTAIVQATIGLAHDLGMRVVAEGVEDVATWARLSAMGCDWVQGYALARPLSAAQLTAFLDERSSPRSAPVRLVDSA